MNNEEIMQKRREKFEEAFPDKRFYWSNEGNGYWPSGVGVSMGDGVLGECLTREKHLEVWNAALDSVVVDIPQRYYMQGGDGYGVYPEPDNVEGDWVQVEDMIDSLSSTGIKTK